MSNQRGVGPGRVGHGFLKPKDSKRTINRLLKYLGINRFKLFVVVLMIILASLTSIIGTSLMRPIINDYIVPNDLDGLFRMLLILFGIYLLGATLTYIYSRIMVNIAQSVVTLIREELFHKMQMLPIKYFDTNQHGDLMSRFTNDIDNVTQMLGNSLANIISQSLTFVGALAMIIYLNLTLTLIKVASLVLMFILVRFIGKKSQENYRAQQKNLGAVNGYIEEMITGQKVVKIFTHEEKVIEDFAVLNEDLRSASTNAETFAGVMMPLMGNISHIMYAILACVGGILTIKGMFDVGGLITFLQLNRMVSNPITMISQQLNVIYAGLAGAERIFEMMDENVEIDNGKVTLTPVIKNEDGSMEICQDNTCSWAWKQVNEDGSYVLTKLKGDVRFVDVVFGYNEDEPVLKKINLFAKPGQKIAFVGKTGAGKTTITNLINRFYDIQSGVITYDGIDIKDIKKDDLRRSLAMVLQDTHLFTGTIAENIRFGNLNASDKEMIEASKLANSYSFISRLPEGFNTVLTNDGENLSQGQRQLLAITRAAIANPPVLILDEATSSIDTRTEKLIEKGMDSLMENRTVFVIAHRLSTVKNAKAILVIEDGKIIERGDHNELMQLEGRYHGLYTGMFK
ncbi:MAG: ABC transporter ATP-binding protein [Erysipelotrichaceae bacterium]|nr:ABC transporter ATP-binding protein [Erysipelotrichaceae bacterium]MDD3924156.1 ABC transporter ATP-binding protein [Erysipelotrichaceae bacterium]MDD4642407.1 ABC transporter ATP-binding protein [Erysipelotrichaceae bacterium]